MLPSSSRTRASRRTMRTPAFRTHQERIIRLADEIILMANGNVAARGEADEIYPQLMGLSIAGCNMLEVDQKC